MSVRKQDLYATGARRDTRIGKGRFDLIDPFLEQRLAAILEYGAEHYSAWNWAKGFPFSRVLDGMKRHLNRYMLNQPDEDHDDNVGAIAFAAMCLIGYEERIKLGLLPAELDDRPALHGFDVPPGVTIGRAKQLDLAAAFAWTRTTPAVRRIYVAGPFSANNAPLRFWNWFVAVYIGLVLTRLGHDVHVPHAATGPWDGLLGYERFMDLDTGLITRWSTDLFYIADSPGANRELAIAREVRHPVHTSVLTVPQLQEYHHVSPWELIETLKKHYMCPPLVIPDWIWDRLHRCGVPFLAEPGNPGRAAECARLRAAGAVWTNDYPEHPECPAGGN